MVGTSDAKIERARLFHELSVAFLNSLPATTCKLCLDLGCGPGLSTRIIANRFPDSRTVGLDQCKHCIERARLAVPEAEFMVCDVMQPSLPLGSPDLIYFRALSPHLDSWEKSLRGWCEQVQRGGLLAFEETAGVQSADPVFSAYLKIASKRRALPDIRLDAVLQGLDATVLRNEHIDYLPNASDVARFFLAVLNRSKRPDPQYPKVAALVESLEAILESGIAAPIIWTIQTVLIQL